MGSAAEDVGHRHRHRRGRVRQCRKVAIERHPVMISRSAGDGHRNRQNRVGTETPKRWCSVDLAHRPVDKVLIERRQALYRRRKLTVGVGDGLAHAQAIIMGGVAVAQFPGFIAASRSPGRRTGTAEAAVDERDIRLDRGPPATVEDLSRADGFHMCAGCHAVSSGKVKSDICGAAAMVISRIARASTRARSMRGR